MHYESLELLKMGVMNATMAPIEYKDTILPV